MTSASSAVFELLAGYGDHPKQGVLFTSVVLSLVVLLSCLSGNRYKMNVICQSSLDWYRPLGEAHGYPRQLTGPPLTCSGKWQVRQVWRQFLTEPLVLCHLHEVGDYSPRDSRTAWWVVRGTRTPWTL